MSKEQKKQDHDTTKKNILKDAYTTVRKSSVTWRAWMNNLNTSTIINIQNRCKDVMNILGYKFIYKTIDILDTDLLHPLGHFDENVLSISDDDQ